MIVYSRSICHELLVLLLISLEDLLDGTKHSLKGVSFDVDNLGRSLALDASLSRCVANQ